MARKIFRRRPQPAAAATLAPAPRELSRDEEIELVLLKSAKRGGPEPDYFPARAAYLEASTGFRSGLITGHRKTLEEMPVGQLISEITHAKEQLRDERRTLPWEPYGSRENTDVIDAWQSHLGALKAEFERQYGIREHLRELDRLRLEVAYSGVCNTGNEWPAHHTMHGVPKTAVIREPVADSTARAVEPLPETVQQAAATANQLEQQLFGLYDQANRPDVVWTENGPEWGDTYTGAEDPTLAAAIQELETKLDAHIATHRADLAADPRWADRAHTENYYSGSPENSGKGENTQVEDETEEEEIR